MHANAAIVILEFKIHNPKSKIVFHVSPCGTLLPAAETQERSLGWSP